MRGLAIDSRYQVRKNLITNPSLEYGTTGWGPANGATIARTTASHSGDYACLVSCPAILAQTGIGIQVNWPAKACVSAWILASSLGWLQGPEGAVPGATWTGSGQWERISGVRTATAKPGPLYIVLNDPAAAQTFTADEVMLTEGTDLLDYFDGDSPSARWTGTPGASTSLCLIGPDGKPVGS